MNPDHYNIGIPVYDGVDLVDIAAPKEIFHWMGENWTSKTVSVYIIAEQCRTYHSLDGFAFKPHKTFKKTAQLDMIWVPGGGPHALKINMHHAPYQNFLTRQAQNAELVCSVCEGAMLLASAGLLNGYEATTHWAFIPCLKQYPDIKVAEGFPRFVVDRNRVTGGGISSGLDEALEIVSIITGDEEIAKKVMLTTQYFPDPPFETEIPGSETCPLDSVSG